VAEVVNDLVTKFSYDGTTAPLDQFNQGLSSSVKLLGGMLAGVTAVGAGVAIWADNILGGVDSLDALSARTDVAVSTIQELNFMATQNQSSVGAMTSTISNLTSAIGAASLRGSDDFARLGISVRDANGELKTADKVLDEVRGRFADMGLTMREQESLAGAIGIDSSLLQLLNRTSGEIAGLRDRARELGTLTHEQTEQAADYAKSLDSLWFSLNSVKQLAAVGLAPQMARLSDGMAQLIADNQEWIVSGLAATVEWIGNLFDALGRLMPLFGVLAAGFLAAKVAALGFVGVAALLLSPIVLWTAGVAAAILIFDDLIVAFQGGKSVIADFFANTFGVDAGALMRDMVAQVMSALVPLQNFLSDLFSAGAAVMMGDFDAAIAHILSAFGGLGAQVNALLDQMLGPVREFQTTVADFFGLGDDAATAPAPVDFVPGFAPDSIPVGTGAGSVTRNQSSSVNLDVTQNITTADPVRAGRVAGDGLQRQLDNAARQLNVGGR